VSWGILWADVRKFWTRGEALDNQHYTGAFRASIFDPLGWRSHGFRSETAGTCVSDGIAAS
jgi:hypothetical protein